MSDGQQTDIGPINSVGNDGVISSNMNILFIHQNFPSQFKYLAPALAARPDAAVTALHLRTDLPDHWQNIRLLRYALSRGSTPGIHPWLIDLETKTIRAEAAFRAAWNLHTQQQFPLSF